MVSAWEGNNNLLGMLVHNVVGNPPLLQAMWQHKHVVVPDELGAGAFPQT